MTKEELEKKEEYDLIIRFKSNKPKYEIRDYIIKHTLNEFDNLQMWDFKRSSEFAEPREKQIQIDAEQIRALQKQNGELTDQVYELKDRLNEEIELHQHAEDYIKSLEAQIDKMKVCQNCNNWNWKHNKCEKKLKGDCFKYSKWVMRNY